MKKLPFLLICFMFLAGRAFGSDILESLADYRFTIRQQLNIPLSDTNQLNDSTLNNLVRLSAVLMVPSIKGDVFETTFVTVRGVSRYRVDSLFIGVFHAEWNKGDSIKSFLYLPKQLWYEKEVTNLKAKQGYESRPSYYDYVQDLIFLYPPPHHYDDTIRVMGWKKVPPIATMNALTVIPVEYRPAVMSRALYMAARSIQSPLTNDLKDDFAFVLMETKRNLQVQGSANATTTDNR